MILFQLGGGQKESQEKANIYFYAMNVDMNIERTDKTGKPVLDPSTKQPIVDKIKGDYAIAYKPDSQAKKDIDNAKETYDLAIANC